MREGGGQMVWWLNERDSEEGEHTKERDVNWCLQRLYMAVLATSSGGGGVGV